jgi:hypothetical protein
MRVILAGVICAILSSPTLAFGYCTAPRSPYCVDGLIDFSDRFDFDLCRDEVERFVSDTQRYSECLNEERSKAIKKANEVVEQFNCKARRQTFC